MNKIAFFVEGATETYFLIELIENTYNKKNISITAKKGKGGSAKMALSFTEISADSITDETKFFVLIINCAGETNIRSYINDQRESLIKAGYSKIIGWRDVYPNVERKDIHKLWYGLGLNLSQKDIQTQFILSVMEIESCFLSEVNHLKKIDPALNPKLISDSLGFNPEIDDMQLRDSPGNDLHNCYSLVGQQYTKDPLILERTIKSIDYVNIYFELRNKIKYIDEIISNLDVFFKVV